MPGLCPRGAKHGPWTPKPPPLCLGSGLGAQHAWGPGGLCREKKTGEDRPTASWGTRAGALKAGGLSSNSTSINYSWVVLEKWRKLGSLREIVQERDAKHSFCPPWLVHSAELKFVCVGWRVCPPSKEGEGNKSLYEN